MKSRSRHLLIMVMLSVLICTNLLLPGISVNAQSTQVSKQSVNLTSTSTISLQNAQLLMQDEGRVLAYTFLITNNGTKELPLSDYWVKIKEKNGKLYVTKITEQDKKIKAVAPKSSRTITYYSFVDKSLTINDVSFDIIQWDFSASNYERNLGNIKVLSDYSATTSFNQEKTVYYNNNKFSSKLNYASITQDQNNAYLQFNYWMKNQGLSSVNMSKIKLFVQTEELAVFAADSPELEGLNLQPSEQKEITLNVKLPKSVIGKKMNVVAAFYEETSNLYLPLATMQIPIMKDNTDTGIKKTKKIYLEGQPINSFLESAAIEMNGSKTNIVFDFALRNIGKKSVGYPNFSFSLITDKGVSYPLTYSNSKSNDTNEKLLPQIRQELKIVGEIPSTINLGKAKLLVKIGADEKNSGYVVGAYQFKTNQEETGKIGSIFKYNDFDITLTTIQRSLNVDNDFITAELTIKNNGKTSKNIPLIEGYFKVNGVKINSEVKSFNFDNIATISPGQTYNKIIYSAIPFTTDIKNISFVLTEKDPNEENSTKQIYQFNSDKISLIPAVAENNIYKVNNIGNKSEALLKRTYMYESAGSKYFYVEFDVNNKENRATILAGLGGYLVNNDNQVVPVSFAKIDSRTRANGKVLLTAWAKLPRNYDSTNLSLVFGQKITINETTEGSQNESSNFVIAKPVKYNLKFGSTTEVSKSLKNIMLAGYEFNMSRVHSSLYVTGMFDVKGVRLSFDYSLLADSSYDYITGDHKLMIEFVDQGINKTKYSKQFAIGSGKEGEDVFAVSDESSIEVIFEDPEIQNKLQAYNNYVVNVYDVFQDAKVLVASKELKWFQID